MVPPIQAPPTSGSSPIAVITGGITTIMITVKNSDRAIVSEISSFFARQAAPTAIAAETPQTDMSAESVMQSDRDGTRRMWAPNRYVATRTTGVTIHAVMMPGNPFR